MGNRHLPRNTLSRRADGKKKSARRSPPGGASGVAPVGITPDERGKLAEDLAHLNVCIYRDALPGEIRKDDIERAEQEIIAVAGRTP